MGLDKIKTINLGTFFLLYISQNLPMSFFATVIPVMMRQENFSLSAIGMLQLIKLPWILKFLWSPIVDKHSRTASDYKRWIVSSEVVYAFFIMCVAFMDFKADFINIMIFLIISFMASATQDIATDALAVLSFSKNDKSMINSMQSMGSFGGSLIGGGVLLVLFKIFGWSKIIPFLGLFVFVSIIPLMMNRNINFCKTEERPAAKKKDIFLFFSQKGIMKQIVFLLLYYAGIVGTLSMLRPYMVDLGYDMHDIGVMSGMIGTFTGFVSSFIGGITVKRLGVHKCRPLFAMFICITTLYFLAISCTIPNKAMLVAGIMLLWGSYGMATIVVYTSAMNMVRNGREGTDFTMQTVVTHVSGIVMAICSGKIADIMGYRGLFAFEFAISVVSLIYILIVFGKKDKKQQIIYSNH